MCVGLYIPYLCVHVWTIYGMYTYICYNIIQCVYGQMRYVLSALV